MTPSRSSPPCPFSFWQAYEGRVGEFGFRFVAVDLGDDPSPADEAAVAEAVRQIVGPAPGSRTLGAQAGGPMMTTLDFVAAALLALAVAVAVGGLVVVVLLVAANRRARRRGDGDPVGPGDDRYRAGPPAPRRHPGARRGRGRRDHGRRRRRDIDVHALRVGPPGRAPIRASTSMARARAWAPPPPVAVVVAADRLAATRSGRRSRPEAHRVRPMVDATAGDTEPARRSRVRARPRVRLRPRRRSRCQSCRHRRYRPGRRGGRRRAVLGSSVDHLFATPAAFGWTWDYTVEAGAAEQLVDDPAVESLGLVTAAPVTLDGRPLMTRGITSLKGELPLLIVRGRPAEPGEIVLGARTMDDLGVGLGDTVVAAGAQEERELQVVGPGGVRGGRRRPPRPDGARPCHWTSSPSSGPSGRDVQRCRRLRRRRGGCRALSASGWPTSWALLRTRSRSPSSWPGCGRSRPSPGC